MNAPARPATVKIGDRYAHSVESPATIIAVAVAADGTTIVRTRRWTTMSFTYFLDMTFTRAPEGHWREGGPAGVFLTRLYAAEPGDEFTYSRRTWTRVEAKDANLPPVITVPLPTFVKPWGERSLTDAEARRVRRNYGLAATNPLPSDPQLVNPTREHV